MDDLTVERVLRVVEAIPAGRVAAYGEVGAVVGVGPRLVGRILREWGSSVPWWRVTNSSGDHPLLARALPHWRTEGIVVKPNGRGCRMRDFGADLVQLRADAAPALAELDDPEPSETPRTPSADPESGPEAAPGAAARPGHSTGTSSRKK